MFDYDAHPVAPQVRLVGPRVSSAGYAIRDFLSRSNCPNEWIDVEDEERLRGLVDSADATAEKLPICILPDGTLPFLIQVGSHEILLSDASGVQHVFQGFAPARDGAGHGARPGIGIFEVAFRGHPAHSSGLPGEAASKNDEVRFRRTAEGCV